MATNTLYGLDIGKHIFHLAQPPPDGRIVMAACCDAHRLAHTLTALPSGVIDSTAICTSLCHRSQEQRPRCPGYLSASRPAMCYVGIKTPGLQVNPAHAASGRCPIS